MNWIVFIIAVLYGILKLVLEIVGLNFKIFVKVVISCQNNIGLSSAFHRDKLFLGTQWFSTIWTILKAVC